MGRRGGDYLFVFALVKCLLVIVPRQVLRGRQVVAPVAKAQLLQPLGRVYLS